MSSRREASRPIERVRIRLTLDGDKDFIDSVSKESGSKVVAGRLSVTMTFSDPQEALEKVRSLATSVRNAQRSKDFK